MAEQPATTTPGRRPLRYLFITWYPSCRRSDALAAALGGDSHLVHRLLFKQPWIAAFKYLGQSLDTLVILVRARPDVVLVAAPPVVAVLWVRICCRLLRSRYVVDAHTGVFDDRRWTWLTWLTKRLCRSAAATITTGDVMRCVVEDWGALATVVATVPIETSRVQRAELGKGSHVVVVNSFSQDEPLAEVLAAAATLPEVGFHVTGSPRHARGKVPKVAPGNLRFTDWLSDDQYLEYLAAADAVLCLTKADHTMQRGAYEAMALGRPLVTSDLPLLRGVFSQGTVFVENRADSIAGGLRCALAQGERLAAEMAALRADRRKIFAMELERFRRAVEGEGL